MDSLNDSMNACGMKSKIIGIVMLGKKDKDKRFTKNCRPISLLNTDMKIIRKVLSARIKNVLPFLISSNQTAYVNNRFKMRKWKSDFRYFKDNKSTCTRRFSSHSKYRKRV